MPAPIRRRKPQAIRRVPAIRRNIQPELMHLVRHRPSTCSSSSSHSLSSSSNNSSQSSRSHNRKHKQSQKRYVFPSLRRCSNSVIPLYGTNGTVIVGYIRPCRSGFKLCSRNG
ncbi:Octanoyltransferase [Dirofilaria immitis]